MFGQGAVHVPAGKDPPKAALDDAGSILLTERVSEDLYEKASPVDERQAAQCLTAVAALHAAAWERRELLGQAAARLQRHGGAYALEIRPNWEHFASEFSGLDAELFARSRPATSPHSCTATSRPWTCCLSYSPFWKVDFQSGTP